MALRYSVPRRPSWWQTTSVQQLAYCILWIHKYYVWSWAVWALIMHVGALKKGRFINVKINSRSKILNLILCTNWKEGKFILTLKGFTFQLAVCVCVCICASVWVHVCAWVCMHAYVCGCVPYVSPVSLVDWRWTYFCQMYVCYRIPRAKPSHVTQLLRKNLKPSLGLLPRAPVRCAA